MKSRKNTISKPYSLRLEALENRELLSAAPWSAPVGALDAQAVEIASSQVGQEDVIDLSNAQLENSVSFVNTGTAIINSRSHGIRSTAPPHIPLRSIATDHGFSITKD